MAEKEVVKFTKFSNDERDAVALDKVSFNNSTGKLTLYSSFQNTIKEEVTIPAEVTDAISAEDIIEICI